MCIHNVYACISSVFMEVWLQNIETGKFYKDNVTYNINIADMITEIILELKISDIKKHNFALHRHA